MQDLFETYEAQLSKGTRLLHPHRWLSRIRQLGWVGINVGRRHETPSFKINETVVDSYITLQRELKTLPGRGRDGVYFATKVGAEAYVSSRPSGASIEDSIQDEIWHKNPEYQLEHKTKFGRIDLFSDKNIIEVKRAQKWKHGIGQLLAYGFVYPNHGKTLHLFDHRDQSELLEAIRPVCEAAEIEVKFQNVG